MLFIVHDEDGKIRQSSKVYDWQKHPGNRRKMDYDKFLAERGERFVMLDKPRPIRPSKIYVDKGEIAQRPVMPIQCSSTTIGVGEKHAAIFTGVPPGVQCTVSLPQFGVVDSMRLTGKKREPISFPVPGRWVVSFDRFPYIPWTIEIEVVA